MKMMLGWVLVILCCSVLAAAVVLPSMGLKGALIIGGVTALFLAVLVCGILLILWEDLK